MAEITEISWKVMRYYRNNRLLPTLNMLKNHIMLLLRKWFRAGFDRPLGQTVSGEPVLIVTHDLGGGTEKYAIMLRQSLVKSGIPVVVLKNTVFNAKPVYYTAEIFNGKERKTRYYSSLTAWIKQTADVKFKTVYCNSLVKFSTLYQWIDYLKQFDDLILPIHDFHILCPSYNLLDYKNQFCDSRYDCVVCIRKNRNYYNIDMNLWRPKWAELVAAARRIICFSESSKEIFCGRFPDAKGKVKVVPHSMDYFKAPEPITLSPAPMRLAVIGNISSIAKGSLIVEDLARMVFPEQLIILGEYYGKTEENMTITGRFTWKTLPELMLKYQINVLLLPTVCPETFSYLASEVIRAQYPLVCFNLGAQAEKVGPYHLGAVCDTVDAEHMYLTAEALYHKVYGLKQ